jgi:hypothetical protein
LVHLTLDEGEWQEQLLLCVINDDADYNFEYKCVAANDNDNDNDNNNNNGNNMGGKNTNKAKYNNMHDNTDDNDDDADDDDNDNECWRVQTGAGAGVAGAPHNWVRQLLVGVEALMPLAHSQVPTAALVKRVVHTALSVLMTRQLAERCSVALAALVAERQSRMTGHAANGQLAKSLLLLTAALLACQQQADQPVAIILKQHINACTGGTELLFCT